MKASRKSESYLKDIFMRPLQASSSSKAMRKFIHRIYRRLDRYFNQDETILLRHIERHKSWKIGEFSYGHPAKSPKIVHFGEEAILEIGNYCSFAEDVWIVFGGFHRTDFVTTYPFSVLFDGADHMPGLPRAKGDIIIGNDVWVCTGATIMAGVTIGNGAVIAAGSVVAKDVPSYSVVAGNPARVVKMRFPEDIIEKLEQIKWWEWPIQKVQKEIPHLLSTDIAGFVAKHAGQDDRLA